MDQFLNKITSRKFIISLAAFLFSLGTGLSGLSQGNTRIVMIGAICCVLSAALYAACEAYTDGKALESKTESLYTNINKTQNLNASTTDKSVVVSMTNQES